MKYNLILTLIAAGALVSCATNARYRPDSKPERIEFRHVRFNVYPEDVRKNPSRYAGVTVAWAGVIRNCDVQEEETGGRIRVDSVVEHHYFDWKQHKAPKGMLVMLSRRGEGLFRFRWHLRRNSADASREDAASYAAPGNLAIVYGVPESVDDDGTIVLKYRYARILDSGHYATNGIDYGRLGEPGRK
jgi:hypothetical protein